MINFKDSIRDALITLTGLVRDTKKDLYTKQGDLTVLETNSKTDLVSSINEVYLSKLDSTIVEDTYAKKGATLLEYGITNAYTKDETSSKTEINSALESKANIGYVDGRDGDLTTLKTADKTNLVKAVNEIHDVTKGVVALYDKNVEAGAGAAGWTDLLVLLSNGRTQRDKNAQTIDLLDFIPKTELANIQNRTSTYDCTPALSQAVATGKRVIISQSGTYKLNTAYIGTTNFEIEATASDVVLDGDSNTASYVIENRGSVTKLSATFVAPVKYAMSVTLNDVSGLKSGDWLCFYCPTDNSYSKWRTYYRAGEWKQIRAIVGNDVYFTQLFIADYTNLTLELYKLNSVTCKLKNVKLSRKNSKSGFVKFSLSSNASDDNVKLDLKAREGIFYDRCVQPKSTYASGINEGNGTDDYGILFSNCQHARALNADIYSRRHAIALGGGTGICSVPVSDFRCYNSVLSADVTAGVGAADMHGNVRDSSYEDCTIYGNSNIGGGEDNYYKRCKIFSDSNGVCGFGREIIGGSFGWIDCEYYVNGNPQTNAQAVFDFGSNNTTTITEKTTKDVTLYVNGKIYGGGSIAASTTFAKVRNCGSNVKINPIFDGIEINTENKFYHFLTQDVISGTANSNKIVVDNISGNMPTGYIFYAPETIAGQSYLNKPMRLQRVVGIATITTTASNTTNSSTSVYPFLYPRKPVTVVTPRGVDGVAKNTYGGQRGVTFGVYSQNNNGVIVTASSATAMTAGDVIEVVYSSEIREV